MLIIAEDVGAEALATLVVNKIRGSLRVAAVRAPGHGDQRKSVLQDIAVLTCGKAVTEGASLRLQDIQISDLGHAEKITIDKNKHGGRGQVHVRPTCILSRRRRILKCSHSPAQSSESPVPNHFWAVTH